MTWVTAPGQEPNSHRQQVTAPLIPELVARHQDMTYDGLLGELPDRPAPRAALEFDPTKARYFDLVQKELELTEAEVEIYRKRGFVSIDNGRAYSFTTAYHDIYTSDLPVLITTDSILYALHESYETMLKELEQSWFTLTLEEVMGEAHAALATKAKASRDEGLAGTFQDVDLYLTVARHLLGGAGAPGNALPVSPADPKRKVESMLGQKEEVAMLLEKIASLYLERPPDDPPTPIFGGSRFIDYSQFRPRGHYTQSSRLQNYFRTMMWLGRADTGWNVLPVQSQTGFVSDDRRELRNAVLFVELLRETGGLERLRAIDRVIAYLVGSSDTLNLFRLGELMDEANIKSVGDLAEADRIEDLQTVIAKSEAAKQLIRSQVVVSDPNDTYKVPPPATFQVFGQRFAIDSYVLSRLVFDSIIFEERKRRRMMPTGVDVMAAFGNDTAVPLLEGELRHWKYSANLLAGREFVDQQKEEFWDKNLYSLWLASLRELDVDLGGEANAPQVMQTEVWQRKQLQTQLASWSQLRHNTVLYTKQSYTAVPGCEYLSGYVEPYPAFYASIKSFAERARELIEATPYTSKDERMSKRLAGMRSRQMSFFSNMASRLGELEKLARKELAAEPFTREEREFLARTISKYGSAPLGSGSGLAFYGWYTELFYADQPRPGSFGSGFGGLSKFTSRDDSLKLPGKPSGGPLRFGRADMVFEPTITDVHTDPESRQALQVGVGPVNLCVIAIDNEDDRMTFVGPVFSYHEFQNPAQERLTDEEWMQMLHEGTQPARPPWVGSFVAPPKKRPRQAASIVLLTEQNLRRMNPRSRSRAESLKNHVKPTDEGLRKLAEFPTLRSLDLTKAPISDEGLKSLQALTNLRNLGLSSTEINGSGLANLSEAQWLRRLLLADTGVTDGALASLTGLPRLEILDLRGSKVTDAALTHLQKMTHLRELDLRNTAIGEAGVAKLERALPKCHIRR